MNKLKKQIDFLIEIDKIKGILRQSLVLEGKRQETDAEHSWHMAMCAFILKDYYKEEINMERVIEMILIHDIVEIYAGDMPAYGVINHEEKYKKELEGAHILFGMLGEEKKNYYINLWIEFENMETSESKFANACDRFQGFLQNVTSDAHTWRKYKPSKSKVLARMKPIIEFLPDVYDEYIKPYLSRYINEGIIHDDKPIKLIVSDLDETLLPRNGSLSKFNIDTINSFIDRGYEFIMCSGRSYEAIIDFTKGIKKLDYIISMNGACIHKNGKVIHNLSIPRNISRDIILKAKSLGLRYCKGYNNEIFYALPGTEYHTYHFTNSKTFFEENGEERLMDSDFEKIVFHSDNSDFAELRSYIEENFSQDVVVFGSGKNFIDVVNINSSKGNAIKYVTELLKISSDEVIAFGDNENDIPMLDQVSYSVAMENAKDKVKNHARYVADSCTNDGVGKFLLEFLENSEVK